MFTQFDGRFRVSFEPVIRSPVNDPPGGGGSISGRVGLQVFAVRLRHPYSVCDSGSSDRDS